MTFSVFLVGNLSYTLRLKMISYLAIYDFLKNHRLQESRQKKILLKEKAYSFFLNA